MMIISEKQVMMLIQCVNNNIHDLKSLKYQGYIKDYGPNYIPMCNLIDTILKQQSEELKVIE